MLKKFVVVLAASMLMAVPALGNAAMAGSNTVNSAAIVDGEVKTADIANLAVTTAKIANGAVTGTQIAAGTISATQLANGAVTAAKLATGSVANGNLIDGSVTAVKIGNGAVTDAKIAGPISTSKLNIGTAAGTVASGDHSHDALYQKKYASVAVVAASGGDYTSPEAALGDIATWCSVMPCLVKVMPGTYTSSSNGLSGIEIPAHITLEGSGEGSTNIICGAMFVYNDAEVRSLTITSNNPVYGYYNPMAPPYANSTGPAIARNLTLNTLSSDATGVVNENGNLELTNVSINVAGPGSGNGVGVNGFGKTILKNVSISMPNGGTGILSNNGGSIFVANSSVNVPTASAALSIGAYSGAIYVNNSLINGQIVTNNGTVKCINSFNASYDAFTCQ
jgi:hypothetical protein